MPLQQEEDIRHYIETRLQQKGIATQREVTCGNGIRADLVTPDMVIEIKRQLNRGALYQAYGQGVAYQKLLKKPKLLIIGLAPTSASKYQEAQRIAENIRTNSVEVVFIDKDPNWGIAAAGASSVGGWLSWLVGRPAKSTARLPFEPVQASITGEIAEKVAEKVVEKATEKVSELAEQAKAAETRPAKSSAKEVVLPPEGGKASAPSPTKSATKSPPVNSTSMKDFWILLLIILVFLSIKSYLERRQAVDPNWGSPSAAPMHNPPSF